MPFLDCFKRHKELDAVTIHVNGSSIQGTDKKQAMDLKKSFEELKGDRIAGPKLSKRHKDVVFEKTGHRL